jgi:benzoyl-CoA reductase/2-hydroxyglutaryl-CoA dehydratase subunit BcrC/BadD/HgdB
VTALDALVAAYESPATAIRRWQEAGGLVAGCVGADVPHELVAAAGLLPVRLRGSGALSPLAEEILGPRVDPSVRLILADLLERRTPLDFLLASHESDSTVRLFTSLRVLARDEPAPPLPGFAIVDLLHLPTETTASYDVGRLRELARVLEAWSGQPLDDPGLRAAIATANSTRRLLAELAELRRSDPSRLSGTHALAVLGAGTVLPAEAYNALLAALLEAPGEPLPAPRRRIYLAGSAHDSTAVYHALEADGSVVVGEDHGSGEALGDGLVEETGDPLAALAARYQAGSALALRNDPDARAAWTAAEAEAAGAEVVCSWIRTGDDPLAWGVPALKAALAAKGIPLVVLDHRGLQAPAPAELAALR